MENIYLPIDNINDFKCYSVLNSDTIRAYYTKPSYNTSSNYIDFYVNSHYLEKTGVEQFNQYYTLPTCLSNSAITNNIIYRNDFCDIVIIFTFFIIITFYPCILLLKSFRKRVKL